MATVTFRFVGPGNVPTPLAHDAMRAAGEVFKAAGEHPTLCAIAYNNRDYFTDEWINSGPAPDDPESFGRFMAEFYPDEDYSHMHRRATLWEDAQEAAERVVRDAIPGVEHNGWYIELVREDRPSGDDGDGVSLAA